LNSLKEYFEKKLRNKKEIKVFKQFQFFFENNLKKVFIIAAKVGIYLPRPVFAHGQLYVAVSRVTNVNKLVFGIVKSHNTPPSTTNIVNLDLLSKLKIH
jgi:FMN-dependent NADH-azoreductase